MISKPCEQRLGLLAAMGLDHADDDIDSFAAFGLGGGEHFVGLADPGRGAQENLQAATRVLLASQQGVWRGSSVGVDALIHQVPPPSQ